MFKVLHISLGFLVFKVNISFRVWHSMLKSMYKV